MPKVVTLSAASDTMIHSVNSTTNYGTAVYFSVGNNNVSPDDTERGLLKFNLSQIPSSAKIISAILTLKLNAAGDYRASNNRTMRVFRVKRDWVEAEATWSIYKTGSSWQTAGGFGANDCEQTDIGTVSLSTTDLIGATKTITLNAAKVQEMIRNTFSNNGFLLKVDTEADDRFQFCSKEDETSGNRPSLQVTYSLAGGALLYDLL